MSSAYKYCVFLSLLFPMTALASEYELVVQSLKLDSEDTAGATPTTETDSLTTLTTLFANQTPPDALPLSTHFDIKTDPDLRFISHPDLAIAFFKKCKELGGYTAVSFDKTSGLKTSLYCITASGSNANAKWSYAAQQQYGTDTCAQFDDIVPATPTEQYNYKYGPVLSLGASSTSINGTPYQRYYCQITFPTPIPSGKKIIQNLETSKFDKAKALCERNGGTFVIDDYTVPGKNMFATQLSLYKFALCIFTQDGDIDQQIADSHWSFRNLLSEYKDKLGSGKRYAPDQSTKRCKRIFDKKDIGDDVNYLGQEIPVGNGNGYYTACQFSIIKYNDGEVFE